MATNGKKIRKTEPEDRYDSDNDSDNIIINRGLEYPQGKGNEPIDNARRTPNYVRSEILGERKREEINRRYESTAVKIIDHAVQRKPKRKPTKPNTNTKPSAKPIGTKGKVSRPTSGDRSDLQSVSSANTDESSLAKAEEQKISDATGNETDVSNIESTQEENSAPIASEPVTSQEADSTHETVPDDTDKSETPKTSRSPKLKADPRTPTEADSTHETGPDDTDKSETPKTSRSPKLKADARTRTPTEADSTHETGPDDTDKSETPKTSRNPKLKADARTRTPTEADSTHETGPDDTDKSETPKTSRSPKLKADARARTPTEAPSTTDPSTENQQGPYKHKSGATSQIVKNNFSESENDKSLTGQENTPAHTTPGPKEEHFRGEVPFSFRSSYQQTDEIPSAGRQRSDVKNSRPANKNSAAATYDPQSQKSNIPKRERHSKTKEISIQSDPVAKGFDQSTSQRRDWSPETRYPGSSVPSSKTRRQQNTSPFYSERPFSQRMLNQENSFKEIRYKKNYFEVRRPQNTIPFSDRPTESIPLKSGSYPLIFTRYLQKQTEKNRKAPWDKYEQESVKRDYLNPESVYGANASSYYEVKSDENGSVYMPAQNPAIDSLITGNESERKNGNVKLTRDESLSSWTYHKTQNQENRRSSSPLIYVVPDKGSVRRAPSSQVSSINPFNSQPAPSKTCALACSCPQTKKRSPQNQNGANIIKENLGPSGSFLSHRISSPSNTGYQFFNQQPHKRSYILRQSADNSGSSRTSNSTSKPKQKRQIIDRNKKEFSPCAYTCCPQKLKKNEKNRHNNHYEEPNTVDLLNSEYKHENFPILVDDPLQFHTERNNDEYIEITSNNRDQASSVPTCSAPNVTCNSTNRTQENSPYKLDSSGNQPEQTNRMLPSYRSLPRLEPNSPAEDGQAYSQLRSLQDYNWEKILDERKTKFNTYDSHDGTQGQQSYRDRGAELSENFVDRPCPCLNDKRSGNLQQSRDRSFGNTPACKCQENCPQTPREQRLPFGSIKNSNIFSRAGLSRSFHHPSDNCSQDRTPGCLCDESAQQNPSFFNMSKQYLNDTICDPQTSTQSPNCDFKRCRSSPGRTFSPMYEQRPGCRGGTDNTRCFPCLSAPTRSFQGQESCREPATRVQTSAAVTPCNAPSTGKFCQTPCRTPGLSRNYEPAKSNCPIPDNFSIFDTEEEFFDTSCQGKGHLGSAGYSETPRRSNNSFRRLDGVQSLNTPKITSNNDDQRTVYPKSVRENTTYPASPGNTSRGPPQMIINEIPPSGYQSPAATNGLTSKFASGHTVAFNSPKRYTGSVGRENVYSRASRNPGSCCCSKKDVQNSSKTPCPDSFKRPKKCPRSAFSNWKFCKCCDHEEFNLVCPEKGIERQLSYPPSPRACPSETACYPCLTLRRNQSLDPPAASCRGYTEPSSRSYPASVGRSNASRGYEKNVSYSTEKFYNGTRSGSRTPRNCTVCDQQPSNSVRASTPKRQGSKSPYVFMPTSEDRTQAPTPRSRRAMFDQSGCRNGSCK